MKYVYCLTSDVEPTDGLPPGLGGTKVYWISFGGISALVSDIDPEHVVGNAQNALAHHEVVQAALGLSPSVIPCRFGTLVANEEKILSLLGVHYACLEANLARVRGKVEVGVEVIFDGIATTALRQREAERAEENLTPGEEYLLAKRQRYEVNRELKEQAERLGRALNEATALFWTEVKTQKRFINGRLLLNLCYLVDRERLSSFQYAYQQFKRRWSRVKLLYTGPWPPYSFTEFFLPVPRFSLDKIA